MTNPTSTLSQNEVDIFLGKIKNRGPSCWDFARQDKIKNIFWAPRSLNFFQNRTFGHKCDRLATLRASKCTPHFKYFYYEYTLVVNPRSAAGGVGGGSSLR